MTKTWMEEDTVGSVTHRKTDLKDEFEKKTKKTKKSKKYEKMRKNTKKKPDLKPKSPKHC